MHELSVNEILFIMFIIKMLFNPNGCYPNILFSLHPFTHSPHVIPRKSPS